MGLEDFQFLYLAGFFDGEGHVSLRKRVDKGKYISYPLRCSISQKSPAILVDIQREFGGYLGQKKTGIWELEFRCGAAERFLKRIYPFVVVKERVIRLGLEARELQIEHRAGIGHPTPDHVKEKLESIKQEISRLNRET